MNKVTIVGAAIMLSACTQNPKVDVISKPAIVVSGKSTERVLAKIAEICDRQDLIIDDRTSSSVVCSKDAPLGAQVLLSTRYGTDVKSRVRFNAFTIDSGVKVSANAWYDTQNAFGQTNKVDINGGPAREQIQSILNQVKSELMPK